MFRFGLILCGLVMLALENSGYSQGPGQEARIFRPVSSSCFFPENSTNRCSFYRDCIEASITCENTPYAYALKYGEKYCNNFQQEKPRMSSKGQAWLDATMICLQQYVNLWDGKNSSFYYRGRSSENAQAGMSCEYLRKNEFEAHPICYLGGPSRLSGATHTSVCDLKLTDLVSILDAAEGLKNAFTSDGFGQMVTVADACIRKLNPFRSGTQSIATSVNLSRITFAADSVASENQQLYDYWVWKKESFQNFKNGLPAPQPPQSIAAELANIEPLPPILPANSDTEKVAIKTRTGYYLNSVDSKGKLSAVNGIDRNPATSDEIFTMVHLSWEETSHGVCTHYIVLMTRSGYFLSSLDSKGPVSAQKSASFDQNISDEVFRFNTVYNKGCETHPRAPIHIRTRTGYYLNSFDSRGDVTAIPSANSTWGISDELFSIEYIK